jgi:hypothetical protein
VSPPDQLDVLRKRAVDETTPPDERDALTAVLACHDECARRGEVLKAARVVAVAWDKAPTRVEALDVYARQRMRGDIEGAELRGGFIVLLDALLAHVREAEAIPDGDELPETEQTARIAG